MPKRKHRSICVVGSRSFPLSPQIGSEVVELIRTYQQGTVFLTRGSEGFDQFILAAAPILGYEAIPFASGGGRENFLRDVELVRMSDEILVFLDPDSLHNPNTGTAHILSKALDQKRKTMAYTAANDHLVFAGSSD